MFANRIAVVTGGGSGIGRTVAFKLAKEGASVVIADFNLKGAEQTKQLIEEETKSGGKHIAVEVDVSKLASIVNLYQTVSDNYEKEPATLLVNCAGITRDKLFINMTEEDFDLVIDVNLKGTFLATQRFCQIVKEEKPSEAAIVNVSSVSARFGNFGQTNYNASKAGVEALTRTVAREMAKFNVRCNAVSPGFIDTPILTNVPQKAMDIAMISAPFKRRGRPEEVAEAISFFLSPRSSYITGTVLQVSGGMTM